jgi:DNA-binding PucR family transcriptional regulator
MALHAGMVMLVGQPSDRGIQDLIFQEATKRGIRVLGIGSASPSRGAEDLRSAADEATIAASLAAALPQFHPAVDASELGGWLLLASASANPAHLHVISPAAHALYSYGDGSQRLTIETYLDVGANVVAACEILFLHRTTLYYRLERMPEVVREALDDGIKRSTLHVALKLIRLWEATGRI